MVKMNELNGYRYVMGNPMIYVDPTGLYNMKTGKVEKGDTLGGITKELNEHYGTDYTHGDVAKINNISDPNKINVGDRIRIGTIDNEGNTWQPPIFGTGMNENYWNSLTPSQQKILHYHRNAYQKDIPGNVGELNMNEWKKEFLSPTAHNFGTSGNVDYRGVGIKEGGQAIYDSNGNIVTSDENMGTYDFIAPSRGIQGHTSLDVIPWIEWGNNPQDTTTRDMRYSALDGVYKWWYNIN